MYMNTQVVCYSLLWLDYTVASLADSVSRVGYTVSRVVYIVAYAGYKVP